MAPGTYEHTECQQDTETAGGAATPDGVLLVSENPELLLETIRSRTQRIDFKKIETAEMEKALTNGERWSQTWHTA